MQLLESARNKVADLLGGIEELDDAVVRGERRYGDKTFAVAYVDFADDVVGRAKKLRAFQERILGEGFFASPGDLRWNKYIYIVAGPQSLQQEGFEAAKIAIEADEEYARKRVVSESELASALGAASYFTSSRNVQEFDILAEWRLKLSDAALDAVLDCPTRTTLIDQIGAGKARRAAASRKALTLHQSDASLDTKWLARLRIESFRPVHDGKAPFDFGQVTLITGPNGTGKTSLLEAIEYFYCGQNRRPGYVASKVFGTLRGASSEMASTTDASRLRARCLKWYNREERNAAGLLNGFDRFNFLDTDAAFRVTAELDPKALPEDLSRLIVGPEASNVWAYIGKLTPEVETARDRSLVRLEQAQSQLQDLRTKLKELQERPSNAKSLTEAFRASLSSMGWRAGQAAAPFASAEEGKPLQVALERIQTLLAAGPGLESLHSLAERTNEVERAFDAAQTIEEARKSLAERTKDLEEKIQGYENAAGHFERWGVYVGSRFATLRSAYLQCKSRVDQASGQLGIYATTDLPSIDITYAQMRMVDAIQTVAENVNAAKRQVSSLEQMSASFGQVAANRARIAQELTAAVRAAMADGTATDVCPVCKTKHAAEVLARHIDSITTDLGQPIELAAVAQQLTDAKRNQQSWVAWHDFLERLQQIAIQLNLPQTSLCQDVLFTLNRLRTELHQANLDLSLAKEQWLELEKLGLTEVEHDLLLNAVSAEIPVNQNPYDAATIEHHIQAYKRASASALEQLPQLHEALTANTLQLASLVSPLFSSSWDTRVAVGNSFLTISALRQELLTLNKNADALTSQLVIANDVMLSDVQASIAGSLRALDDAVQAANHELNGATEISVLTESIAEQDEAVRSLLLRHMNFRAAAEALTSLATELSLDRATTKSLDAIGEEINGAFERIHSPNEYEYVGHGDELLRSRTTQETWSLDRVSTGQRAAFALSVFLALNRTATNAPPVVLIDDPVAHVDDLNTLSFLDYLRDMAVHSKRQIFFATADARIASLFTRKFGFLGEDFKRIDLPRELEQGAA